MRKKTSAILAMTAVLVIAAGIETAAQVMVCFKKRCLIYSDGTSICEYTPVDCSKVEIT